MQSKRRAWLIAPLIAVAPLTAVADDNDAAKLISECGIPDLPQSSVDSCLERVRILEETEPSPQLQSLEGNLEQRTSGHLRSTRSVAPRIAPAAMATPRGADPRSAGAEAESGTGIPDDEDRSQPPSGAQAEDEPPIADPPDALPAKESSRDEQPNDPGEQP
jgi:hypothetical protein